MIRKNWDTKSLRKTTGAREIGTAAPEKAAVTVPAKAAAVPVKVAAVPVDSRISGHRPTL